MRISLDCLDNIHNGCSICDCFCHPLKLTKKDIKMTDSYNPNNTPNIVVENPNVRKGINVAVSTVAVILGTVIVVDAASPAFDLAAYTNPISAGILYLASVFNLAITLPNTPRKP